MTLDPRTIERSELEGKLLPELHRIAQSLGVTGSQRLRKGDLIAAIIERSAANGEAGAPPAGSADGPPGERTDRAEASAERSENGQIETTAPEGTDQVASGARDVRDQTAAPTEVGYHEVLANWAYQFAAIDPPASARDGKLQVIGSQSGPSFGHAY